MPSNVPQAERQAHLCRKVTASIKVVDNLLRQEVLVVNVGLHPPLQVEIWRFLVRVLEPPSCEQRIAEVRIAATADEHPLIWRASVAPLPLAHVGAWPRSLGRAQAVQELANAALLLLRGPGPGRLLRGRRRPRRLRLLGLLRLGPAPRLAGAALLPAAVVGRGPAAGSVVDAVGRVARGRARRGPRGLGRQLGQVLRPGLALHVLLQRRVLAPIQQVAFGFVSSPLALELLVLPLLPLNLLRSLEVADDFLLPALYVGVAAGPPLPSFLF
mmetsp:Transcript_71855/g.210507  ORF Transcript_71855/g.210507 Transcript_71855/m.210507 type:complete len:271 (+) Transcript_71855:2126-2938(+)